jgi:hypothetical protein
MTIRMLRLIPAVLLTATAIACSEPPAAPTPPVTNQPTPPAPAAVVTVSTPTPVGPSNGTVSFGWPTFTVHNATKTNTTNALMYRFDVSNREDFATVAFSGMVSEGPEQTSYTPPATQQPPSEGVLYWRALALDQASAVQSATSSPQAFTFYVNTEQNRIASTVYGGLWPGARPTGTHGRAAFGPGWQVRTLRSFDGVTFQSPPIETLRIFDLLDLGYDVDSAINWMRSNGYPTTAVWYPSVAAIGFPFQYMALIRGEWELVVRVGA